MSEKQNNLWQLVTYDDLLYFLRKSKNGHVVLSIVLQNTPKEIKSIIKSFIKDKSKIYNNVTFLYYIARKEDLGKNSLMNKDVSVYPFLCCIYDIKNILAIVHNIDCVQALNDCFGEVENDYIMHKKHIDDLNYDEIDIIEDDKQKQIAQQEQNAHAFKEQVKSQLDAYQQGIEDKKRLLDKLILLKQKGEQYQLDILNEVGKRKKEEKEGKKK